MNRLFRALSPPWFRSVLVLAVLLASTTISPAIVKVLPEEKPKTKVTQKPKSKPKSVTSPARKEKPSLPPGPTSDFLRRFVGTWSGTRTGSGTLDAKSGRYPYTVSSTVAVSINDSGATATVRLGSGTIRWTRGGPEGQATSDFTAKPHPSFSLRESSGAATGTFHTVDGNWIGDRAVHLGLSSDGQTLNLSIDHTGKNRSSSISDSSTSHATLRR